MSSTPKLVQAGTFQDEMQWSSKPAPGNLPTFTNDSAIASGEAFISSSLEKERRQLIEPVFSVTYHRDLPIRTGGGWVEYASAMNVAYGLTGGSSDGAVGAPGANAIPIIQANLQKDIYKTHIYEVILRIPVTDMNRMNQTGYSLEKILTKGIRTAYDKHQDANGYVGMPVYGTLGLVNQTNITSRNVAAGASGSTEWANKTPEEILADINTSMVESFKRMGENEEGIPDKILLPYDQYVYISTRPMSALATKSILTYLLENHMGKSFGKELKIDGVRWLTGAGAGGSDRMITYVNKENFLAMEELVPLQRTMTGANVGAGAFDSLYQANLSEVEIFFPQAITYSDGI